MLFSSIVAVIPFSSLAATAAAEPIVSVLPEEDRLKDTDALAGPIENYKAAYGKTMVFDTAEEMLNYELDPDGNPNTADGYLDSIVYGNYAIYINRYTGFVYYQNVKTGQILTSNPLDPAKNNYNPNLYSQIELEYFQTTDANNKGTFTSMDSIYKGSMLKLSKTADGKGIIVTYRLADTSDELIAPLAVPYDKFVETISKPAFNTLAAMLQEACGNYDAAIMKAANGGSSSVTNRIKSYNLNDAVNNYIVDAEYGVYSTTNVGRVLGYITNYAKQVLGENSEKYILINDYITALKGVFTEYDFYHPERLKFILGDDAAQLDIIMNQYPALKGNEHTDNKPISVAYLRNGNKPVTLILTDRYMRSLNVGYTMEMLDEHEKIVGYTAKDVALMPSFNCSLEYRLDANGAMIVTLSDVVSVGESADLFEVRSVTPLKYFGAGNMNNDGYIFFPDGSGAVVDFSDFRAREGATADQLSVSANIYGSDYCYGTITGAHREQVTMPVYGLVSTVKANATSVANGYASDGTITNGFFAIIEEGESISKLGLKSEPGNNAYACVYSSTTFTLFDEIDLAQSLSVSSLGKYAMVADGKYEGVFKTRYVMLADEEVVDKNATEKLYPSSYVGMAYYYRDYLEGNGVISALSNTDKDLPLYVEALGSMDIVKKILSFPVTVSTPLTTFEDVENMYAELSSAVKMLEDKAKDYRELANGTDDDAEKASYLQMAEKYDSLAAEVMDIKNINFKLTGFSNGGMYYTYPAKLKWERSVGGKKGFKDLVAVSDKINTADGDADTFMNVYPDFDFMYISNTAMFDGISKDRHASRMIDNRYASQQVYSSISQSYEKLFTLLTSSDALDSLYKKFNKKYSKYDNGNISVSTLGSDLNSNLDSDNLIDRETAKANVSALLEKMSSEYSVMINTGNIYAVKYADHILDVSTDSSHFRSSSYAVPFVGMVLHGYVNYAGSALNFSGSPDYDILRAIENGASIYYVLCCQNTNYLKEDKELSSYYGIDYYNWFDKIAVQYATISNAIGDLQSYKINDHKVIIGERIIDSDELEENYRKLADEFVENVDLAIFNALDAMRKNLVDAEGNALPGKIYLNVNVASLVAKFADKINASTNDPVVTEMAADLAAVIASYSFYTAEESAYVVNIDADDVTYESKYYYTTESVATDGDDYRRTEYSCDNGNIVMVTYENAAENKQVVFILNYNSFDVEVRLSEGADPIVVKANGYVKR